MNTAIAIRRPMHVLRDAPNRSKIIFITLLTSGVALLLTCLAFVTYEMVVFKTDMVDELSSTAAMIADNSSAALAFSDPVSAAQTLKSLRAHSHIVEAAIYDAHGKVFAEYRQDPSLAFRAVPPGPSATTRFGSRRRCRGGGRTARSERNLQDPDD